MEPKPIHVNDLGEVYDCDGWPSCKEAGCKKAAVVRQEMGCENPELSENVIRSLLAFMAAESYSLKIDVLDTPTCEKLCSYLEAMLKTSQENALCLARGFFNFKSVISKSPFYQPKK